ncbi:MAG TPA: hydrolase [Leptospiraceae bacterium]|nr:hydrolase [Spirochaetaceae bacterium]HBS03574.1 hydrolase [Leptospiraceae bacterium]|tara:strand:+ start:27230 stop:28216 length:987 start_codon:yes stop_codon:yes gene_type:complete
MNLDQTPKIWIKHPMIQSTLASRGKTGLISENPMGFLFQAFCPQEDRKVRLYGLYDLQPKDISSERRLAILLHGWEGSSSSAYVLRLGRELYGKGWDVLRMNLRDHGPTHHLNEGLFNGSLIHEVYDSICQAVDFWQNEFASREPARTIVAGFSMGGNFAIRIAGSHSIAKKKISGLAHIYAISPAVDPEKTTRLLDSHPVLSHYFLRKWFESLKIKEKHFPDTYNFGKLSDAVDVMTLTDRVARIYSHYRDASHYFQSYTIQPEHARKINVPLTILSAQDDPIIAPEEVQRLEINPNINLIMTRHGGHNGFFLNGLKRPAYLDLVEA